MRVEPWDNRCTDRTNKVINGFSDMMGGGMVQERENAVQLCFSYGFVCVQQKKKEEWSSFGISFKGVMLS